MTDKTVETVQEPKPGTPEYDAKMIAVARAAKAAGGDQEGETTSTTTDKPTRPDNVPEKFWNAETGQVNVEALLSSYAELEKGKSTPPDPTKIPKDNPDAADKAAQDAAEKAGLNWDDLRVKVVKNGQIDEADYSALEKAGVPKTIAEEYIELVRDKAEKERKAAVDYIGGDQAVADLFGWASKSLTPAEIDAYNEILGGPGWKAAVDALKVRKAEASKTAKEPSLTTGVGAGQTGVVGYQSREEMKADIANPLYTKMTPDGVAFRKLVEEKTRLAAFMRR